MTARVCERRGKFLEPEEAPQNTGGAPNDDDGTLEIGGAVICKTCGVQVRKAVTECPACIRREKGKYLRR